MIEVVRDGRTGRGFRAVRGGGCVDRIVGRVAAVDRRPARTGWGPARRGPHGRRRRRSRGHAGRRLADWWTGRRLLRLTAPGAALAVAGPALAGSVGTLVVAAVGLGVLLGVLNVALSVQAVAVER